VHTALDRYYWCAERQQTAREASASH